MNGASLSSAEQSQRVMRKEKAAADKLSKDVPTSSVEGASIANYKWQKLVFSDQCHFCLCGSRVSKDLQQLLQQELDIDHLGVTVNHLVKVKNGVYVSHCC